METSHLNHPAGGSNPSLTTVSTSPGEVRALPRSTHQFRALSRKTLSYQKRQWFVNICCLALCPFAMVAIAGIMGIIVRAIVSNANPLQEYLYCSNLTAMTSSNLPITNTTRLPTTPASQVPGAQGVGEGGLVRHTNFLLANTMSSSFSTPTSSATSCVFWFGHSYPPRAPYESAEDVNNTIRKDTTFKPDPRGGWLGPEQLALPSSISQYQTFPWALVSQAPGVSGIGTKPRQATLMDTGALTTFASTPPSATGTGLLGSIDADVYVNISRVSTTNSAGIPFAVSGFQPVPYFINVPSQGSSAEAQAHIDDQLASLIQSTLASVAKVNKTVIERDDGSATERLQYYVDVATAVTNMPWGAIHFDRADPGSLAWSYTLQMGMDKRIQSAASYPSAGIRLLAQQSQLSTAFARQVAGGVNTTGAANALPMVTHGFRVLPQVKSSKFDIPVASYSGNILYPFGISFLLPVFVIMLVREKEERIRVMMEMNGLSSISYYVTHYIHFYILYIISIIFFIIAGFIFQMELFTQTQPGVYILLFFVWGHAQIALAFFFSSLFSRSRSALALVFLVVLLGIILNSALEFVIPGDINLAYFIWPPFAFYRSLSILNVASTTTTRLAYRISDLRGGDQVMAAMIFLAVETLVFLVLAYYLAQVIPGEYGVRKPWYFPLRSLAQGFRRKRNPHHEDLEGSTRLGNAPDESIASEEELQYEDNDVREERRRVLAGEYPQDSPLVLNRMRKVYPNGKLSVKDITLATEKNQIFGLLGPNGAGKTSLISMLTGLYPSTWGEASISGYDLRTQLSSIFLTMGVCPQHDILWGDLTVEEHLYFYARLKGVPVQEERAEVEKAISRVSLTKFARRLSRGLSGGEKRRLSIAISLMGDPGVVFLDEPTTGLDPEVKRIIWDIVNDARQGRTIILTTHSMEEAEVLCQRIAIMAKGTLRCIGSQLRLKQVYGSGFRLTLSATKPSELDRTTRFVESLLPPDHYHRLDTFVSTVSYEFQLPSPSSSSSSSSKAEEEEYSLSRLFERLEKEGKAENGMEDWGLSQVSLEEVFLKIIGEDDADAE